MRNGAASPMSGFFRGESGSHEVRDIRTGQSALELAAGLLAEYGGVNRLSTATAEELAARPGVGQAKAAALLAAFQLGRHLGSSPGPATVRRPDDLATFALRDRKSV